MVRVFTRYDVGSLRQKIIQRIVSILLDGCWPLFVSAPQETRVEGVGGERTSTVFDLDVERVANFPISVKVI